jgi:Ca2+-binding EF-hand superfamily protein
MKKLMAVLVALGLCVPVLAVAQEKKANPEEQFKKLDSNNDGKLTKEEFLGKRKGEKATKAEETFKKKDKNGDGSLSLEEFVGKKKDK